MNSEGKTLSTDNSTPSSFWIPTWQKHYELILAVVSGIFILAGWILTKK